MNVLCLWGWLHAQSEYYFVSQHVLVLLTTARLQDCPLLLIGVCCTGKSKRVGALSKLKTATVEVKENHHHSPQPQHTAIAAYTELTTSAFTAGCIPLISFKSVTATKRQWCLSSWDVCRMCMMFRFVSGCVDFFLLTLFLVKITSCHTVLTSYPPLVFPSANYYCYA